MSVFPYFVLAGNAPYENRGCEAIVRGTVEILERSFSESRFKVLSFFTNHEQFENQKKLEIDSRIQHGRITAYNYKRFSQKWFSTQIRRRVLHLPLENIKYDLCKDDYINATSILSVGGDNYSLDYGIPTSFTMLDDYVLSLNRPMVIWGASVGPFSKIPEYEKYIAKHLRKVTAIFARETATIDYLSSIGVKDNVYLVADPAFVMTAQEPPEEKFGLEIMKNSIGLNLSPLMARYMDENSTWEETACQTLSRLCKEFDNPIYLIPHVTRPDSNDYIFLKNIMGRLNPRDKERVFLVPPTLNAQETKWVISHMYVFAGARTHSTIAALSSFIPTLSIAYSMKARGINQDLLGTLEYCVEPKDYCPDLICEKISELLRNRESIQTRIVEGLPSNIQKAYSAGDYLRQVVNS